MNQAQIARINELYHKSKSEGLTKAEAAEQKQLRADYIAAIRGNLQSQLEKVSIVNPDGTITDLSKKQKS